jgi:hypothetical protein
VMNIVMTGVTTAVATTTTTMTATIARSPLLHLHLKWATPIVCFRTPTDISTSSSVATKQPRATDSSDQTQGRSAKSTPKLHNPNCGWSSLSLSLGKTTGCIYPTPGPTRWLSTP